MIAETAARLRENIQKVIVGKADVIDLALIAMLCEGHLLLEDVPGTGKTTPVSYTHLDVYKRQCRRSESAGWRQCGQRRP